MVGKYPGYSQADYQYLINNGDIKDDDNDDNTSLSPGLLEIIVDATVWIAGFAGTAGLLYYLTK